jgi:UMF1 family MFS transporter
MKKARGRRQLYGWMMFDWASQPYNTLLLTFIFGPYFAEIVVRHKVTLGMSEYVAKAEAQSLWAVGLALTGVLVAVSAPVLGALADSSGRHIRYLVYFSFCYCIGSSGLWFSAPDQVWPVLILAFFMLGLYGTELATIFTNSFLPTLGNKNDLGRISGSGWAVGYLGGLISLILALLFFAENDQGMTLLGRAPIFGLDPDLREGTRMIGPLSAAWFAFFMIPFFMYVSPIKKIDAKRVSIYTGVRLVLITLRGLPKRPSFMAYLGSSMFYRDALNAVYSFGGIYAYGVLGWSVVDVGIFGIMALVFGVLLSWLGGFADSFFGPKPVIELSIVILIFTTISIVGITPESIFFVRVSLDPVVGSLSYSDCAFYLCGAVLGGVGGVIQSASRTMLVHQATDSRITEAFGLYAFAGKATSFLAPALIAFFTIVFNSQRVGMLPIIFLFIIGLILMAFVKVDDKKNS